MRGALREELGDEAVVGGERSVLIEGFDLGASPRDSSSHARKRRS